MGDLFKGYVMAQEFAGWDLQARLEGAGQHANGKYKSLIDTMNQMHAMGYAGIEVAPFTCGVPLDVYLLDVDLAGHEKRATAVREATKGSKGAVTGLHWILSFLNAVKPKKEGLSLFADTEKKMETFNYYKLLIDYCAGLGGTYMVHGSPPSRQVPDGYSVDPLHAAAHFYTFYGPNVMSQSSLVDYAKDKGVRIGFETLAANEPNNFITSVNEGLKLAERVNHPNFGITIDVKAMANEGKGVSVPEIIRSIGKDVDKIVAVHFNDPSLTGPRADGVYKEADWVNIMGALAEIGWKGHITIEPFEQKEISPIEDSRRIIDFLNECERKAA